MSTTSLASSISDGASGVSTGNSFTPYLKESSSFDKCPQCKIQYDFLKRANNVTSKVPLVLNCKHTVCEDCIRRLCLANAAACPVCDEKFVVPRTQLDALLELFTPHFALIGYLMWMKNSPGKKQITWISTGLTMKNKQCFGADTSEPNSEVEENVETEGTDSEIDDGVLSLEFDICSEHVDGFCNIHCETCNKTICCYCFLENHGGHQPIYLYKLSETEMSEMKHLKTDMELVLQHLQKSQKKIKELKTFDLTHIENEIKNCFSDLHAKLHVAERNIRKKLLTFKVNEPDLNIVNLTLKSGIAKVTQVLKFLMEENTKSVNLRNLYEESQELKKIPCRLVSDCGTLESIRFVCENSFDDIEQNFSLTRTDDLAYSLVPVEDWNYQEENPQHGSVFTRLKVKDKMSNDSPGLDYQRNNRRRSNSEEGSRIKVTVTHLNDLNSFYVQKQSVQVSLRSINHHIEKRIRKKPSSEDIRVGRLYGVKYETKKVVQWRRGKLIDVVEKGPCHFHYNMFFIDYGNSQYVTVDKLKELDGWILKKTPYAFECKLTNPHNLVFDSNTHLHLAQIIDEKNLYLVHIKKQSSGPQEVDLQVPSSDGTAVSVRDILFKTSNSEKEERIFPSAMKLFKNSKRFSVGQEEQVMVSYVKDPFHICVQLVQNIDTLKKMRNEMTAFYENHRAASCVPVEDTYAVVNYKHDLQGEWHRGKIISVSNADRTVDVYFVDWGGCATVAWSKVKLLAEQFTKVECQAITVKLADIQRQNVDEPWSREAIDFLNELVSIDCRFKMTVNNVDPLDVALFRSAASVDVCLNSQLVERQLAVSTGNISETLYWPNQQDKEAESDDDDDELSVQLIKKSEEVLMENEDFPLKQVIKRQVSVIRFENPELIYIKFLKHKEKEEEMEKELQIHYSNCRSNQDKWEPSEDCVIFDSVRRKYFRGVIKSASGPDAFVVYLYDHVREVKVSKNFIFKPEPYFKKFNCYVFKCRLANVRPAGDRRKWSKLAIEILQKIFSTYKIIHITKIETNADEKKFGVLMWYSLTKPAKALEPSKYNFISINKVLVESGVAFTTRSATDVLLRSEKEESSDRFVDEIAERSDEQKQSKSWYEMICENEEFLHSSSSGWPKALRLQNKEFEATLICVDSEGCFSVRDEEIQNLYESLEENLSSKFSSFLPPQQDLEWQSNEMCTIAYENKWYRGTVIELLDAEEVSVEMIDFGSAHVVDKKQLYKQIMFLDLPPLINKVRLYDVQSKYGAWCENDVEELLGLVTDRVKVVVKNDLNVEIPHAEVYLENGLSVNDLITEKCPHLIRYQTKVALRSAELEEDVESDSHESKATKSSLGPGSEHYTYVALPKASNRKVKMYIVNVLKWGEEYKAVLNVLNSEVDVDTQTFEFINEIQGGISDQPTLDHVQIDVPCVCLHPQNNKWCRAVIHNIDSLEFGYVLAFFVDYGTIDIVDTANLKKMRPEWFDLPVYNRIAIINIELLDTSRAEHVLMQMNSLRRKTVTVEIVSENPLKVHLYEGKTLCYQNFIKCNVLRAL